MRCSSSRASSSRFSVSRASRSVSACTSRAVSAQSSPSGWSRATSSWVRMLAIGLRSSCAVSETRSRWCCCASASRESMSFSVTASARTSSRAGGTGRSRGMPVCVTSAAPRRNSVIGRSVYPVSSQVARASRPNSSGVPIASVRASVVMLSLAWANGTAASTTWPPLALTATTRSSDGRPSGGPASMRPCPVRAAARACAGGRRGTRRSAPGDTSVIRPWASSTWMVIAPDPTGTGSGSRFWSISAATSAAPCRAESSSPRIRDSRSALTSSTAAAARATASPAEVTSVSRARRLRCRHHRATVSRRQPRAGSPPRARSAGHFGRTARRSCVAGIPRRPRPR